MCCVSVEREVAVNRRMSGVFIFILSRLLMKHRIYDLIFLVILIFHCFCEVVMSWVLCFKSRVVVNTCGHSALLLFNHLMMKHLVYDPSLVTWDVYATRRLNKKCDQPK